VFTGYIANVPMSSTGSPRTDGGGPAESRLSAQRVLADTTDRCPGPVGHHRDRVWHVPANMAIPASVSTWFPSRTPRPWMQRVRSGPDEPRSQTPFAVPGSTDDKRASGGPSPNGGGLSGFDPDRLFGPSLPQWENLRATSFPEKSSQRLER